MFIERIYMSKTNNTIITLSTIATIYDKTKKDKLDLLMPFVKYCISESFNLEEEIQYDRIINLLEQKFGFKKVPISVLNLIFDRMTKKNGALVRKSKKYYYCKSLKADKADIDIEIEKASNSIQRIYDKIKFVIEVENRDECLGIIFDYMNQYGFEHILINDGSKIVEKRKEINNKKIAEYIIEAKEKNDPIFYDFELVYKGLLLMNTIYFESSQYEEVQTNFRSLDIYLDTVLILGILGIKIGEISINATNIKELLPKNVTLKCFKHNYDEVYNIIEKYKIGTIEEYRKLDMFEIDGYTEYDKNLYLNKLDEKFKEADIIIDDRSFSDLYTDKLQSKIIDIEGLSKYLKEKIGGGYFTSDTRLQNDVDSIQYISLLRGNTSTPYIEKCKAIFVSSNYKLVLYSNEFVHTKDKKTSINNAIFDADLVSILWLKGTKYNTEFTREYMLKCSQATKIKITDEFIDALRRKKSIYEKQNIGKIDILDMIENNYVLNRLSERTYGNPDLVSYEMIEEEVADLAEDHAKKRIETLKQGNEIMLREKDLKIQEAENVSKRKDKQIDYFINRKAKSIELIIKVPLVIISFLMFIAIFIIVLYTTINSYIRDEANLLKTIGMITIMIGDIAGYIWGFITKQKKIYKGIDKLAKKCSNKYIKKIEDKIDKIE